MRLRGMSEADIERLGTVGPSVAEGLAKFASVKSTPGIRSVELVCTVPPSANSLFCTVTIDGKTRRVPTTAYNRWRKSAATSFGLMASMRRWVPGKPCGVSIAVGRVKSRGRDLGNFEKPITDALVTAGVLFDDNLLNVTAVDLRYDHDAEPGVVVTVRTLEGVPS